MDNTLDLDTTKFRPFHQKKAPYLGAFLKQT